MKNIAKNKLKIFNDPIYGFISIPFDIILELIDHPYFQRLRRIKQLGMSHMVYPGALHTRFHHAMGAMHLMTEAIEVLRSKGLMITEDEAEGACIAILLHDIGHGPFSHALENTIVENLHHEDMSLMFMHRLNKEFKGKLDLAIKIFTNKYKKKFLHQLVSSQLDMDRLDYLKRDSFFTGVSEGVVSSERIIKMLNVVNDDLVVEDKGIYSVEKFIVARRLMYWQVYLHKTVVSAEFMLVNILTRAKYLAEKKVKLFCSPHLEKFLYHTYSEKDFSKPEMLDSFSRLDDYDILGAIKVWVDEKDKILSLLCKNFVDRRLFKIELQKKPFSAAYIKQKQEEVMDKYKISKKEIDYLMIRTSIINNAYNPASDRINILYKDNTILDIAEASDNFNINAHAKPVEKFVLGYMK